MRWVYRVLGVLVLLLCLAVAALFVLPSERIAKLATDQIEAATGRSVTIDGDVRPTLWPNLGVSVGDVTIANANWSQTGPMVRAEKLVVAVELAALLAWDVQVKEARLEGPKILLELAEDGRANWQISQPSQPSAATATSSVQQAAPTPSAPTAPKLAMDQLTITDGQVVFVDHGMGLELRVEDVAALVSLPRVDGPLSVDLSAKINGQPVSVALGLADLWTLLNDSAVETNVSVNAAGSVVKFDGQMRLEPMAASGAMEAKVTDLAAMAALVRASAPELPLGFGRDRIAVNGQMSYTPTGLTLRQGQITLDDNVLTGAADVSFTGRPKLTAQLAAAALDFSALIPSDAASATTEAAPTLAPAAGYPKDRIDVSAMQAVDADIALTAESIDLGVLTLGPTDIRTGLDAGRAVTQIRQLTAYDGTISGSFVVNSRGGLSARSNLTGTSVSMLPLLTEFAGYDRLETKADFTLNLLGIGDDIDTLMRSLSGDGGISFGAGELRGLDLVGMIRNLDPSYVGDGARTIFDTVAGSFTVEGGVLTNRDLQMTAPLLTATGAGALDLGGQGIDFKLVPALLDGQTNGGVKIPLHVTGPWSDPRFRLDLESLAEQELADEVEAVKNQAEEAILKRVEEETGVQADAIEDLDEKLKEELQNRVNDGLRNLLGGN